MQVLAAVAEFERTLIAERTRMGMAAAKEAGRHVGRPRKGPAPTRAAVSRLLAAGASWAAVARDLGCTATAARRAVGRG
jgi:putative DNA-invertase from lambdoid prophage Rac